MTLGNKEVYSVINYITAILLLASPWIFNYPPDASGILIPLITGVIIILCNLCTQWKFSLWEKITMHHRLMIDLGLSCFLILCPKLIAFEGYAFFIPYLWIGIIKLMFFLLSTELLDNASIMDSAHSNSTAFKSFLSNTISAKKSLSHRDTSIH